MECVHVLSIHVCVRMIIYVTKEWRYKCWCKVTVNMFVYITIYPSIQTL